MTSKRKYVNLVLITVVFLLGGEAIRLIINRFSGADAVTGQVKNDVRDSVSTHKDLSGRSGEDYKDMANRLSDTVFLTKDQTHSHTPASQQTSEPRKRRTESTDLRTADLRGFTQANPFFQEAQKVLGGNLNVSDSVSRQMILNYCEHFRTAYTTRDIDFLRQVFSEDALIIVGHTVKRGHDSGVSPTSRKVVYSLRSKSSYLKRLESIFSSNSRIDVKFSDFHIRRHPTVEAVYGVSLRQEYVSDRYSDDGYLFLLWDFRNPSMPLIHVRTWQPEELLTNGEEPIGLQDFNLE